MLGDAHGQTRKVHLLIEINDPPSVNKRADISYKHLSHASTEHALLRCNMSVIRPT